VAVVFFYFKYTDHVTLVQVLEALLAQLASVRLSTHQSIHALEDHWAKRTRPSRDQLLSALQQEISSYSHAYIVVDALDELHEDLLHDFVDLIRTFPSPAHILITSRDIPSISALFPDDDHLDILADDSDMRTYIENQISKQGMLNRQVNMHPPIKEQVIAGVIEKARGMYVVRRCLHITNVWESGFSLSDFTWSTSDRDPIATKYYLLWKPFLPRWIKCTTTPCRESRMNTGISDTVFSLGSCMLTSL
jgi:hypothetical protein